MRILTASAILALAFAARERIMAAQADQGRSRADIRITLLGTGNPRPTIDRFGPATLVEAGPLRLLFDAGRGATIRLFQIGAAQGLSTIDGVFLTHLHSDHLVGFADLWLTGWIFGRDRPLNVFGPPGTRRFVTRLERAYSFDVRMRRDVDEKFDARGVTIRAVDITPGLVLNRGGVRITAFDVDHAPVTPALGYRVDFAGRAVVLSGDTRPSEELVRHAAGADVLIHEVVSGNVDRHVSQLRDPRATERVIAHHTTPEQAAAIFARVRPRLAVYSHIVPSPATADDLVPITQRLYDGRVEAGRDGMTIDIGREILISQRVP